jgi:hypothetical protein
MTVRELIEHLQTLDPERNVWVIYDTYMVYEPDFSEIVTKMDALYFSQKCTAQMQKGDYKMEVG